jgi:hemerythrin-like metal-binding protein
MTWSSRFSVGVEALDSQHKALMKALNELHAASMRGEAGKVAGPLLRQIVLLAIEHFWAGERLMDSIGFPGRAGHRAKHKELTAKIEEFVSRHEKGDTTMYSQLLYFMRDWLNKHMQTDDQEYALWLSAHGVH